MLLTFIAITLLTINPDKPFETPKPSLGDLPGLSSPNWDSLPGSRDFYNQLDASGKRRYEKLSNQQKIETLRLAKKKDKNKKPLYTPNQAILKAMEGLDDTEENPSSRD